ncbi:MAG: beta-glucosidase BglX [Acidobacteria bacterium]|nr:beta-glucosidase BglX [Acidobacteriota bacterium]
MMTKGSPFAVLIATAVTLSCSAPQPTPPDADVEARIDALLGQMTLEEKVGQMNQYSSFHDLTGPAPEEERARARLDDLKAGRVGSMLNVLGAEATRAAQKEAVEGSRLGIPLIFGYDVIHGYRTIFPVPLGEAASWDLEAIEASARVAATEAAAAGVHWTFAPMVDICRDARWGRIMEGAGEDPFLGARIAAARVRGFQGASLSDLDSIAACAKHYAAYGLAEGGRDYNTVDISEQTLRNVVLPPFHAAEEAGVATFMNSFNEIGGVPSTASVHLQREILKGEWGFEGFVVSDWGSIGELVAHGVAADLTQAAQLAVEAGSDMDMEAQAYVSHLVELVESGRVEEARVDDAVRRILRIKFALGLFDDPYRYSDSEREKALLLTEEHLAAARDVARKSIVLLKNEGGILPLEKGGTIAVIGPFAADKNAALGSWRGQAIPDSAVSLVEGIQAAVGSDATVLHAEGVPLIAGTQDFGAAPTFVEDDRSGFPAALDAARRADVVVLALGEGAFQSGEARSQADIGLKGLQDELLREVLAVNENVVVVLTAGRPLVITHVAGSAPAILNAWLLGSEAGHAIADVLFGDYNPSGKLPASFPRSVGQIPVYYAHKNTGRPATPGNVFSSRYIDMPNEPLYPFGYGLSYTTFEYSAPRLSAAEMTPGGSVEVTATVKNTGERVGTEVVQLYVRDLVGSVTRPVKELKGFRRVTLEPGESKDVSFTLEAPDLAFFTAEGKWEAEPGDFVAFVGPNSRDTQEAPFTLK